MKYRDKWPEYAKQWDSMKLDSNRIEEFEKAARYAIKHKAIYQQIELETRTDDNPLIGVPWPMVACNHWRESSGDFDTYLGNGQPLNQRTTIKPIGRGPFTGPNAFIWGAVDAYKLQKFGEVIDWRLEKLLFKQEQFNGEGYNMKGLPSPYIWGGTNIQKPGKYVVDGVFDPGVMDSQLGCAGILYAIAKLDPTVKFVRETPADVIEPPPPPPLPEPAPAPVPAPSPAPAPSVVVWQNLLDRRKEIVGEIRKLQAEDADIDSAIKTLKKYAKG